MKRMEGRGRTEGGWGWEEGWGDGDVEMSLHLLIPFVEGPPHIDFFCGGFRHTDSFFVEEPAHIDSLCGGSSDIDSLCGGASIY